MAKLGLESVGSSTRRSGAKNVQHHVKTHKSACCTNSGDVYCLFFFLFIFSLTSNWDLLTQNCPKITRLWCYDPVLLRFLDDFLAIFPFLSSLCPPPVRPQLPLN